MKQRNIIILLFLLMLTAVTGCKSSKTATEGVAGTETTKVLTEMAQSYRVWDTFSTSGKLSLSGAVSFSTSMQLKMVRNKCISISIRPILGIEVAKLYVDKDSAVLVNKYHKVYTTVELEHLADVLPVNIGTIQDILLARAFTLEDGTLTTDNIKKFSVKAQLENSDFVLSPRKKNKQFSYEFVINKDGRVEALNVRPSNSGKTYSVEYSDYGSADGGDVAGKIALSTTIEDKDIALGISMNSSKTKWDGNVDEGITVNKSYRKVTVSELISLLKQL